MGKNNGRMLEFEKAVSATLIADVQISPDGEHVAYVTTPASKEGEYPCSEIWLATVADGSLRRLTTSEATDAAPRWSPDGRRILFASDRKKRGTTQLYLLSLDGGEAIRLTEGKGGVSPAAWSPDGSTIAFTVKEVESEDEKERKAQRDDAIQVDGNVRRSSLWIMQVPEDVSDIDPANLPEPKRISPEEVNIGSDFFGIGFSWSPDGSRLVTATSKSPKPTDTFMPEIVTISTDGAITSLGHFEGVFHAPKFSPDGATILINAAEEVTPALYSLQTIPASGGEPTILAPGYHGSFYTFEWLPDGKRVVTGVELAERHVFQVLDIQTGAVTDAFEPFDEGGTGAQLLSVSADGKRIAFVRSDQYSYGNVFVADIGGKPRQLTDVNPWVRDYQFGEVRDISWTAKDGLEIQGLLILPVGYEQGRQYPTLVHIHGGPQVSWTHRLYADWKWWGQFLAQRGYAVFLPNPRGSSGRGVEFLCSIVGCYGEPDSEDILTGVDYLVDQGIADPEQLVVGGWSGGGFLTYWMITHTDRFKAAVSGAGVSNWISFQGTTDIRSVFDRYLGPVTDQVDVHWRLSPVRSIANATTPTLIVYGEKDSRVPPSQGHEMYAGLKSRGVETQLVIYPRDQHGFQERKHQLDLLERVIGWFDCHLGRSPETS